MLVGRSEECERVGTFLSAARAGDGGALVVRGVPGIGKTALLDFAARLAGDARVLRVTGVEAESSLPYAGLHELLATVSEERRGLPDRQSRALRIALTEEEGSTDPLAVCAGTSAVLSAIASTTPLVIVVDDAHWVDAETATVISFVARRISNDAIGLLLSVRSDAEMHIAGAGEMWLSGIGLDAARELVGERGFEIVPSVVRELWERTSGNPLALRELPPVLDAEQRTARAPLADPLPVTASIERAFLRRVDRLSETARRAVLLAAASDEADVETVRLAGLDGDVGLAEAEREGLVRVERGSIRFSHPLVRSAVYSAAPDGERRSAHESLARATAVRQPTRSAWHHAEAGGCPDELVASTLEAAGEDARRGGALASATRFLTRAAAVTPSSDERARRLLMAARAAWLGGLLDHAAALLEESEQGTGDPSIQVDIACARWWLTTTHGDLGSLFESLVAQAERIVGRDDHKAALLLATTWDWTWMTLDLDRGRQLVDRSQQLLGSGVSPRDSAVLTATAWQRLADCRVEDALAAARLALRGDADDLLYGGSTACEVLAIADELDESVQELAAQANELERLGSPPELAYTLAALSCGEQWQGRLLKSLSSALDALALAEEGATAHPGYVYAQLASVEAALGLESACRAHVKRVHEIESGREGYLAALALAALGHLELSLGNHVAAGEALDAAHGLLGPIHHPGFVRYEGDRIEAMIGRGDEGRARAALAELDARVRASGSRWAHYVAARARVALAPVDALDETFARTQTTELESPWEHARTHLIYGERLRRAGRRKDARIELAKAMMGFETTGAATWERRSERELRASGGQPRRRGPSAREDLTPRELHVALVVAEGLTNREAATRLYLSPKTIELHLSRVYRKLNVRNRSELARQLALHPLDSIEASARVPDDTRVVGPASIVPGRVGQAPHVVPRSPAEQELGLRVVEPRRVVRGADGH